MGRARVVVGAAALLLVVPLIAAAQGLGDASKKEKERREQTKAPKAKTYTQEDLPTLPPVANEAETSTGDSAPPPAASRPAPSGEEEAAPPAATGEPIFQEETASAPREAGGVTRGSGGDASRRRGRGWIGPARGTRRSRG